MRRLYIVILCAAALGAASTFIASVRAAEPPWRVCFTLGEDCTGLIVNEIAQANSEILVQAYSFTPVPMLSALKVAHDRGVDVKVIVDKTSARVSKSGSRNSAATYLTNAGIPVWVDTRVSIAHNKVMVIDQTTVTTGSFNFTAAAQNHNGENLLVIRDSNLAGEYRANWQRREAVSIPHMGFCARQNTSMFLASERRGRHDRLFGSLIALNVNFTSAEAEHEQSCGACYCSITCREHS